MDAEFELLEGNERSRLVDHAGCCQTCGFMEPSLIAWRTKGAAEAVIHCSECFVQQRDRYNGAAKTARSLPTGRETVYLPEMPPPAFSHYLRALAFISFAALTDNLGDHDFSTGKLPPAFGSKDAWDAALKWKSISEGLACPRADRKSVRGFRGAQDAYAFLSRRLDLTASKFGSTDRAQLESKLDQRILERDFRTMNARIPVSRIRSWGERGATFRIVSQAAA